MSEKIRNRFSELNTLDVGEHIEKKLGLSYLSWAWAWAELQKKFPGSYSTVYENKDGWNYWTDGKTCWVKTGVTLVDGDYEKEFVEMLPVMDKRNRSIPLDAVTSMDVNTAIQRSITKAIARHGIGLYIYAGEDLPEEDEDAKQARAEEAKKLAGYMEGLDHMIKEYTKSMDNSAKLKFYDDHVVPVIGVKNYHTCSDMNKIEKLFKTIIEVVGQAA